MFHNTFVFFGKKQGIITIMCFTLVKPWGAMLQNRHPLTVTVTGILILIVKCVMIMIHDLDSTTASNPTEVAIPEK